MTDYLGHERSEDQIAALAESWRVVLGVNKETKPDVLWCVETGLPRLFPNFALIPRLDSELPKAFAVADHRPPRIDIRDSVYAAAKDRHPRARFILAHEFAHVVLQDQEVPKFLLDGVQERMRIKRMSLENHADEFAQHFLVPQHIVSRMKSIGEIMKECGVTYRLAVDAGLSCGIRPRRKLEPYEVAEIDIEENDDFSEYRLSR